MRHCGASANISPIKLYCGLLWWDIDFLKNEKVKNFIYTGNLFTPNCSQLDAGDNLFYGKENLQCYPTTAYWVKINIKE